MASVLPALILILAWLSFDAAGSSVSPCDLSTKTQCGLMALGLKDICQCLRADGLCYDSHLESLGPKQVKKKFETLCRNLTGFLQDCARSLPCRNHTRTGVEGSATRDRKVRPTPKMTTHSQPSRETAQPVVARRPLPPSRSPSPAPVVTPFLPTRRVETRVSPPEKGSKERPSFYSRVEDYLKTLGKE